MAKDGQVTEYFDVEAGLPPDFGVTNADNLKRMDCIDCHNRISHNFRSPDDSMDDALNTGLIDKTIPYIKAKGAELSAQPYQSKEQAHAAIESLDSLVSGELLESTTPRTRARSLRPSTEIKAMFDDNGLPRHVGRLADPSQQRRPQGVPRLFPLS